MKPGIQLFLGFCGLNTLWAPALASWMASFVTSFSAASSVQTSSPYVSSSFIPPQPLREIRAVWVASVANIDWPSTNAVTAAQQKSELSAILDRAVRLKLNTIILQVRPACDALYASSLEPWSEYLTGTMGKAPEPYYDPLSFAVAEAHKRGLELHAWFNPFRARHLIARSPPIAFNHVSKTHPELVRQYGRYLWLDPGEKGAQDYSLAVIMDVVRRYDIDGVHFDDYFYPYAEHDASGKDLTFPDEGSWRRYGVVGKLSREDWRRDNINCFVRRVYASIKGAKPWVQFGISPFGIWRPGYPSQIQGLDAFASLYADSRKWLQNGWVDYLAPQLYWEISRSATSFPVLLHWWSEQNAHGRLLLAGIDATKTTPTRSPEVWKPGEILNQVRITRQPSAAASGQIFWNMGTLMRNNVLDSVLEREVYQQFAITPALAWLDSSVPDTPKLIAEREGSGVELAWEPPNDGRTTKYLLQTRRGRQWSSEVLGASKKYYVLQRPLPDVIALRALTRFGNASSPAVLELKHE
jgi:uncharacterized lipoprotein YddW (UPF0748 family)